MLDVVYNNTGLFQDYFRLKGQWLGLGAHAPLRPLRAARLVELDLPYGDAVEQVLTTLHRFDRRFGELAERVFRDRHIDSEIRKGKRGGAFCATVVPRLTPWVLVNYTGRYRDVADPRPRARPRGAQPAGQPPFAAHPASAAAAGRDRLGLLRDPDDRPHAGRNQGPDGPPRDAGGRGRRHLRHGDPPDLVRTLRDRGPPGDHRKQVVRGPLRPLREEPARAVRHQHGARPSFRYEWLSIPHIYNTPFYCYAYSFGQLLVLALYRRYQQEGPGFIPGYVRLLGYGGSRSPAEALAEMDIDIADPNFWQGGFDVVRDMITELKSLEIR